MIPSSPRRACRATCARVDRPLAQEPPHHRAPRLGAALHDPHLPKWLHRIDVPVQIIWGNEDRILACRLSDTLRRLPAAQTRVCEDAAICRTSRSRRSSAISWSGSRGAARELVLFHLMPYAELDLEAGRKHGTVWVHLPNRHFDPEKGHQLYNRYLDELEYGEALGFDAVSVNEHHQTAYGLMPSPIVTASALSRKTSSKNRDPGKRAAAARASADRGRRARDDRRDQRRTPDQRLRARHRRRVPHLRRQPHRLARRFHEAHDLIVRAWTEPGPFAFQGKHYNVQYVNLWPRPYQKPHPPIWIPRRAARKRSTGPRTRTGAIPTCRPSAR